MSITIGGISIVDPTYLHQETDMVFIGPINDMPFFTNYMMDYFYVIQNYLQEENKPLLTTIRAIRYLDKYDPRRFLTRWIAYSDDLSIGWYKYAGLVAGETRHKIIHSGEYHSVPSRHKLLYKRRNNNNF